MAWQLLHALPSCHSRIARASPEHQWTQHLIGIAGAASTAQVEHRINGQFRQHCYYGGEILIIPAGASYWASWQQEAEFSLLGITPQFLEQMGQEAVKTKRIELMLGLWNFFSI